MPSLHHQHRHGPRGHAQAGPPEHQLRPVGYNVSAARLTRATAAVAALERDVRLITVIIGNGATSPSAARSPAAPASARSA